MDLSLRISDLQTLAPDEQEAALAELVTAARAPINGQAASIKAKIARFESRYEMTSEEFLRRLKEEDISETAEYAEWLFWLDLRARTGG